MAVRRGAYLRGYAHAFIQLFAPQLSEQAVSNALAEGGSLGALTAEAA